MIATLLAVATAFPLEDTEDVAAAKAAFNAAFAAEAGEHAALAPVNTDAQAAQIAAEYLADAEEVAAAKAAFQAAFDDAAAGGLAAKQAPAPVAPVPAPLAAAPAVLPGFPYGVSALNAVGAYPYNLALPAALPAPALPEAALPAAALPATLPL